MYAAFRETGTIFCSCSGPRLPDELVRTADDVYLRLHGPEPRHCAAGANRPGHCCRVNLCWMPTRAREAACAPGGAALARALVWLPPTAAAIPVRAQAGWSLSLGQGGAGAAPTQLSHPLAPAAQTAALEFFLANSGSGRRWYWCGRRRRQLWCHRQRWPELRSAEMTGVHLSGSSSTRARGPGSGADRRALGSLQLRRRFLFVFSFCLFFLSFRFVFSLVG